MAWAIKYMEFWRVSSKDPIRALEKVLEECMAGLIPDEQDRFTKGLSAVVLANTLALGWLTPATCFVKNRHGEKVKAVAIVKSVVDGFADISHADDSSYDLLGDYELTEHLAEVLDELELKIKEDLEGSASYKSSSNAFIFSFVNKDNLPPFKSPVKSNQHAIYSSPTYGSTFGGGHVIHIANNANANTGSYTDFGYSYQSPSGYSYSSTKARNLLASTYRFTPEEVETFYLN
ncbi:Hypothetical predicted protein [Paramuricea clavata]|uniref:TLDc domain-containing protein n=1 Tax=Paramuricea clavata TaxID=317549 RepID=A0A6S7G2D6_PARCT|nr:Hypothetical predicted protein [Paramuricea clavata]